MKEWCERLVDERVGFPRNKYIIQKDDMGPAK